MDNEIFLLDYAEDNGWQRVSFTDVAQLKEFIEINNPNKIMIVECSNRTNHKERTLYTESFGSGNAYVLEEMHFSNGNITSLKTSEAYKDYKVLRKMFLNQGLEGVFMNEVIYTDYRVHPVTLIERPGLFERVIYRIKNLFRK